MSTPPALPSSLWIVAWASLAGQAMLLVTQAGRPHDGLSLVVSVLLGALVVGYVSAGVVRARTIRLLLAWVVLVLSLVGELVALPSTDEGQLTVLLLSLTTTVLAMGGLASFCRSEWYAWQRTRPPTDVGAPISPLVAIGVLVGVLGGLTGPVEHGFRMEVRVADR